LLDEFGDLSGYAIRVGVAIDADRDVSRGHGNDDLVEVPVADDDVAQTTAVEVAPLARERQQRGVDQKLFEEVGAGVGRACDPVPLFGLDALTVTEGDVADVWSEAEDGFAKSRVHLESNRVAVPYA
jgi:hypothetical protein